METPLLGRQDLVPLAMADLDRPGTPLISSSVSEVRRTSSSFHLPGDGVRDEDQRGRLRRLIAAAPTRSCRPRRQHHDPDPPCQKESAARRW